MKPSERINEIENQDDNTNRTDAIIQFLNEEWEKKQACKEHNYDIQDKDERCIRCLKPRFTPV